MSDQHESAPETLAELTRLVHAPLELNAILTQIAELAVATLTECDAADVTVIRDGQPTTLATTQHRALTLDDAKYTAEGGPCVDSAQHQRVNRINATSTSTRFEPFCRQAAQLGIASTLTLPLATPDDTRFGALSLYSMREHGFSDDDERTGTIFATHTAAALAKPQEHD